jgi:hypothetical protein
MDNQQDAAGSEPGAVAAMVQQRKAALGEGVVQAETWGLALSGGGVRSATFSFGLLKSLARNGVLRRFDILSTVSGGGYVGAMVGKLHHERDEKRKEPVEAALGNADNRWFAWWLRANGRYLVPRGTQDLLFALATYARNLVGIHLELALLAVAVGLGLSLVDIGVWALADFAQRQGWGGSASEHLLEWLSAWPTPWLLLPIPVWLAAVMGAAYWIAPSGHRSKLDAGRWLMALAATIALALTLRGWEWFESLDAPDAALAVVVFVLLAWIFGTLVAQYVALRKQGDPGRVRNMLTRGLARMTTASLLVLFVGGVDYLAWQLAMSEAGQSGAFAAAMVAVGVALRALLPKVAELPRTVTPGVRRMLATLVNLVGLMALTALAIFWISLVHHAVTMSMFPGDDALASLSTRPTYMTAVLWWLLLAAPVALIMAGAWTNIDFLNRSSLHTFYRARLIRGYLGAANGKRFGVDDAATAMPKNRKEALVSVKTVHDEDDLAMSSYAPHRSGGPVHLVNVCINQTRDPGGGLFNQDRKGLGLSVGPLGWSRVAQRPWRQLDAQQAMTLGTWTAISGAAVSPGLGSQTRPGIAALAMMAGIRLGYWWPSPDQSGKKPISKYSQLLSELVGRFDGDSNESWFLSDGGHFENTGAYALLQERCRVIVVADCGADPRFAFGDIENLVRKARIDLGIEIKFLKHKAEAPPAGLAAFGSLNDIVSAQSSACLAIAVIEYTDDRKDDGYMIVVKPSMCAGLPVDLVNFKADTPAFPQESTTDQFFDEAQWESYYRLGAILGKHLDETLLKALPEKVKENFVEDDGAATGDGMASSTTQAAAAAAAAAPPAPRLPARIVATGAVTATVSLGAIASLALSAWQAVEVDAQQRGTIAVKKELENPQFKDITTLHSKFENDPGKNTFGDLAAAVVRLGEATCSDPNAGQGYKSSPTMKEVMRKLTAQCSQPPYESSWACDSLEKTTSCLSEKRTAQCLPRYWVRDYRHYADARDDVKNCEPKKEEQVVAAQQQAASARAAYAAMPASAAGAASAAASVPRIVAVVPPSVGPQAPATADPSKVCYGKTLYAQIYGPERREEVRSYRPGWRELGISIPPIEDVWDSATKNNRQRPVAVPKPTLVWHDEASKACAHALAKSASALGEWAVNPLPTRLNPTPGVVEAWVPPLPPATAK